MARINVTKAFLPPKEDFLKYVDTLWDSACLTNNGPLLQQLEAELQKNIGVNHVAVCTNGTVVLQMALKALEISGEVITTPFSYVATLNAILWENCKPVFVDIDPETFCINADLIERSITENTRAILCTHVYGFPCDIEKIQEISEKYRLPVIYDGAHAFGCNYKSRPLLQYGDISTCSFHATKLFHTVEGGCVVVRDENIFRKIYLQRQFGHIHDEYFSVGINGKNSELHAAMGLCVLPHVQELIRERKAISELYDSLLKGKLSRPHSKKEDFEYNYSYYPVILKSETELLRVKQELEKNDIYPRRYFFPSLNKLSFLELAEPCPVSEDISVRVLCLPLYPGLPVEDVRRIAGIVLSAINR